MYIYHWQSRIFSFAVSAMLTSAVLATAPNPAFISAQAFPQPAQVLEYARNEAAGMATPTAAQAPRTEKWKAPLTQTQLQELLALTASASGTTATIHPSVARIHKLAKTPNPKTGFVEYPAFTAQTPTKTITFIFAVISDDGGYVFGRSDAKGARSCRLTNDLDLYSSVVVDGNDTERAHAGQSPKAEQDCFADVRILGQAADKFAPELVASAR